ncbi:MAG TPA: HipA domain-containing protein [Kofleriaceae bacterium]|jgi:serine/threonine-protein kinase HipA|nr:HipA domain-containing protein [Kofleriaceae bacterium]
MERLVDVYLAIDGSVRIGRLWARACSGRESASFEFTDPAPDRWGQTLLRRHERVPRRQLATVLNKPVLIIERFDRRGSERIPYMSAPTAMAARDGDTRSYLELAEVLQRSGAAPARDLEQLWRRVVFNVLVSNVDDHLRNHGFLHEPGGWRLAPAFDLDPVPTDVRPRGHALAIDEDDPGAPLPRVLAIAPQFNIKAARARAIVREVAAVTRRWRRFASDCSLTQRQFDRMATAFEHDGASAARAL